MLDQERVDRNPVALGDPFAQGLFRLFGRAGPDHTESVRDPMDVRVDGDRGDPVPEDEHAVRGLGADPVERGELLKGPRNLPPESVEELRRAVADYARLDAVETGGPDEGLDLGGFRAGERGRVGEPGEQARARDIGVRVAGPLGEDCSDQHLEGVLGVVAEIRPPPIARAVERA